MLNALEFESLLLLFFMVKKLLIGREQARVVNGRRIVVQESRAYYIDDGKDVSFTEGMVRAKELQKKDGSVVTTNTGKKFHLISASFADQYQRMQRLAQIIMAKDIGWMVAESGIGKESTVVDCGTGSGFLAVALAHIVKKVVTYDINEKHIAVARRNIEAMGIQNIILKKKDVYQKIDEKGVELVVLDVAEPWRAVKSALRALRFGGFLVSYSPNLTQVQQLVAELGKHDSLIHLKTVELIAREWKVQGLVLRPRSEGIGHTGFLTLGRKV